ncbi:FtsX-like permease family protein [Treponema pedis]|uniref:Lipoprotein releasing system, permease n=1 Tax=Treponema pedis str. T A4 TaxID=1291379 RepID=S6A8U6_9SPIR|nr:FtsX-like permease family protein [Treponema pedis]AGT44444.1 lipoprotein releasing system, permease [Treponema pedis str. T A4]
MKKKLSWIFFVLNRFNSADTQGRSSASTMFSILGIAFGVTVLIVILSVMNGFQMGYIDTIMQVSSAHIRLYGTSEELQKCENLHLHESFFKFKEVKTLLQGDYEKQHGILLRAVEHDVLQKDFGFAKTVKMTSGSFNLEQDNYAVIGYELARQLALSVGDTAIILAAAGSSDTDIFPENRELIITGIFKTGYYAVDSSFAFVSLDGGNKILGNEKKLYASVKLKNQNNDVLYISSVKNAVPEIWAESWRSYNHAFFGALQIEKNMMLLLIVLIFLVVAVNIYNGMRRSIYERREDISVLVSMGAYTKYVQFIFIANGFTIGFIGSVSGLLLGLFLSLQINSIFAITEQAVNKVLLFISILSQGYVSEEFYVFNPVYLYMEDVPVRLFFGEILSVFLFGVFSASSAALIAAKRILKFKPAEVMRYE